MTKRTIIPALKYLINFGAAGLLAGLTYFDYALWVHSPIGKKRQVSIELLKSKNIEVWIGRVVTGLIVIGVLTILTWLTQTKVEKWKRQKDLFAIMTANILIVGLGLAIGIMNAYNGLIAISVTLN